MADRANSKIIEYIWKKWDKQYGKNAESDEIAGCGIITVPNGDKDSISEKWERNRDLGSLLHPFRAIGIAPPGRGKTTIVNNLILKADPPFERIVILHPDIETKEYDLIDNAELVEDIPDWREFERGQKTLFILEDVDTRHLKANAVETLTELMRYGSTHIGISCLLLAHQPSQITTDFRRLANNFLLWPTHDLRMQNTYAESFGITKTQLDSFMKQMPTCYDFLMCDLSPKSPAPFRRGLYEPLFPTGTRLPVEIYDALIEREKIRMGSDRRQKNQI